MQLPLKPLTSPDHWSLGLLPFVLTEGGTRRIAREGVARLEELPDAARTALVMPAPDVLLLQANWPHLTSLSANRQREALSNLLEESLIQPVDQCHFALGARDPGQPLMTVAVVDLAWMRFIHGALSKVRMGAFEIFPATLLQPELTLQSFSLAIGLPGGEPQTVIAWHGKGQSGWGLRWNDPLEWQTGLFVPEGTMLKPGEGLRAWAGTGRPAAAFDLCQAEFAPALGGMARRLRPWRGALLTLVAVLLLQLLALNGYWLKLAWQKRGLEQSMRALVRNTLPDAPEDVAPAVVLKRALENQRLARGGALPGDFSALTGRLAALLVNEPGDVLQQLDYRDDSLLIRFKPGYSVDVLIKKSGGQGGGLREAGRGIWRLTGAAR